MADQTFSEADKIFQIPTSFENDDPSMPPFEYQEEGPVESRSFYSSSDEAGFFERSEEIPVIDLEDEAEPTGAVQTKPPSAVRRKPVNSIFASALGQIGKVVKRGQPRISKPNPARDEPGFSLGDGSANDIMNEKLAALKERDKMISKLVRKRGVSAMQDDAREEVEALAQLAPSVERVTRRPILLSPKRGKSRQSSPSIIRESANPNNQPDVSSSEQALLKTLQQTAKTTEEKYRILDCRDRLYQSRRELSNLKRRLVATCPDMCPEKERMRRCYQMQVSVFEMKDHPRNTEAREEWMVKEYSRSSADQETPLPHDLRPISVLQRTMAHLCRNIADRSECSNELLDDWYMFMWDRTRAIRKDLTHQDVCSPSAVQLLEQCARFHIHCAERLVDQDTSVYDDKINSENLTKCLQTLKYMYNDLRTSGVICDNAPEFLAYSLLLNLNNTAVMTEIRNMPEDVTSSHFIRFALDIITARETKNYIRFFRLVKGTTYLNACILRRYFNEMRVYAFIAMVWSHFRARIAPVAVSVMPLVDSLMYESVSECLTHLRLCNLTIVDRDGDPFVFLDKKSFQRPETSLELVPSEIYVRVKKTVPLSELIWGGPLGDEESPPIQCSFTQEGEFKMSSIYSEPVTSEEVEVEPEVYDVPEEDEYCGGDGGDRGDEEEHTEDVPEQLPTPEIFSAKSEDKTAGSISGASPLFSRTNVLQEKPKLPTFVFKSLQSPLTQPKVDFFSIKQETPSVHDPFKTPSLFAKATEIPLFQKHNDVPSIPHAPFSMAGATTASTPVAVTKSPMEEENEKLIAIEQKKREEEILRRKIADEKLLLDQLLEEKLEEEEREERRKEEIRKEQELEKKQAQAKKVAFEKYRNEKLAQLKKNYMKWKLRVFAQRWRQFAIARGEERKVENYKKVLARKYPPVCSPELLNGNPAGIVIPNALQVGSRSTEKPVVPRSEICGPPPSLPLVDIWQVVAPTLTARIRSLYPDPTSTFRTYFPWKLVISLPNRKETGVRFDTFLEMHFVNRFNWKFGKESEPLCSGVQKIDGVEVEICVRRVKGPECYEGDKINPNAVKGANSLIFFLTDEENSLQIARQRLLNLRKISRAMVVVFVFGWRLRHRSIRTLLSLQSTDHVLMCGGDNEQSLVTKLSASLLIAASIAAPVPTARSVTLSSLLKTNILEQIWRRCETAAVNFDVELDNAECVISHYNKCLDNFMEILLSEISETSFIAPEFEKSLSKIESMEMRSPPVVHDDAYRRKLENIFKQLALPPWPNVPVKSTDDLNYRMNQYAESSTSTSKEDAKWRVYQVIKDALLWKGLDIYCDEDIETVLAKFPWVAVLREFALIRLETVLASPEAAITVTYHPDEIRQFCYLEPLIRPSPNYASKPSECPLPERDSILIAYSRAVEREKEEMNASRTEPRDFQDQVAEALEMAMPLLIESEEEPLQPIIVDQKLKRAFDDLSEDLSKLKDRLEKRRKVLEEMIEGNPVGV